MRYSFDKIINRRSPDAWNKWTRYPEDVLPMWVADMDFLAPPPILNALRKFVEHGDLGYETPSKVLLEAIVGRMRRLYGWKISADMIVPIPGVNSGYNVAARTFCTSRRGYLIQTPVYYEFLETRRKTGAPQIESPLLKMVDGNRLKYGIDFDSFGQAVKKVNLFLLCNPHNPVGNIYSRQELKRMAGICIENDVLIVSDEIHSELLLDENSFKPLATLGAQIASRTITLISASKAFNVPGLFCAFAIIPNKEIRKRYEETVIKMGLHLSSPGLAAARVAYSGQCDAWLNDLRTYLTGNRDFLVEYVTKYLPGIRVTVPSATYLAWLDCSDLKLRPSPYEFFLKEARVALSDGEKFGQSGREFVRLNFGTSRRILRQALDRMSKALG